MKISNRFVAAIVAESGVAAILLFAELSPFHLWIKALHLIAAIAWMAGLLYLPRLFAYHCEAEPKSSEARTFKRMESRLLRIIMNPAMHAAWLLGLWLAWKSGAFFEGWFHAKLAFLLILTAIHVHFSRAAKAFERGENRRSARYWRVANEIPALLMAGIVILAVVRPF